MGIKQDLYSSNLKQADFTALPNNICRAVEELRQIFPDQKILVLYWNKNYVVIPVLVEVDIPTRGPVGNLDIREQEPIMLLLHVRDYPHKAPLVWSDRKDFPADKLPHLNPTSHGMPASLCLHRGSIDDWFAEHSLAQLVCRIQGWFRDAASNRLIRAEDGFEPTRIQQSLGLWLYDPSLLTNLVYDTWRNTGGNAGYVFLWVTLLKNPEKDPLITKESYAVCVECPVLDKSLTKICELSIKINWLFEDNRKIDRFLFGLFTWQPKDKPCHKYFGHLPNTLSGLLELSKHLGIPLKEGLEDYLSNDLQLFGGVPIILALLRPQRLIGGHSKIELLNFVINWGKEHWPKDKKWNPESPVYLMEHRTPLTLKQARNISSLPEDSDFGKILLIGCGAIGSKVALHLARSGQGKITLVDHDSLSPHNLVRHGLLPDSLGINKAHALKDTIEAMFYADKTNLEVEALKCSALELFFSDLKDKFFNHSLLIDATASSMILNVLSKENVPSSIQCCRCEIADEGRLGFLSFEGKDRNPRLDDIQVRLFDLAIDNKALSCWLTSHRKQREDLIGSRFEEITIGISCSSETMRLPDDVVSLHAASFSMGLRNFMNHGKQKGLGRIQISRYPVEGNVSIVVQEVDLAPFSILTARNDPSWQIRMTGGLDKKVQTLLRNAKPNETGGLLVGMVHFKRKVIYVTRILLAPPDSKSSPYAFIRGVEDVPVEIRTIEEKTGGMFGYVGEWHTHPKGGPNLSNTDKEAIRQIRSNLDSIPLPTHILVVTTQGLYPYVFSPR